MIERVCFFITTSENEPTIINYKILKAEWEPAKAERAAEIARVRDLARADGMRPLIRLLERRIARPFTDAERTSLSARFDLVGPERLGDVVLDLSPDALAAWIADPDARRGPRAPWNLLARSLHNARVGATPPRAPLPRPPRRQRDRSMRRASPHPRSPRPSPAARR